MKNKDNIKYRFLSLFLFFVISLLANISKADDHIYSKINYIHVPETIGVELVVAPHHSDFRLLNNPNLAAIQNFVAAIQIPISNRYVLLHYGHDIIQKIKTLELVNSPHKNIISILQKKNTRHQSEQSDPSLI
jgi:hypothetical protein